MVVSRRAEGEAAPAEQAEYAEAALAPARQTKATQGDAMTPRPNECTVIYSPDPADAWRRTRAKYRTRTHCAPLLGCRKWWPRTACQYLPVRCSV